MESRSLRVGLGVLHHVVLAYEALVADLAHERLLAGVQAHVPPEIRLVVELLRAQRALVRLVAGVLLLVLLEQVRALEPFAAQVTFKRLVSLVERVVVLSQIADPVERLVALRAFERSSGGPGVLFLLVHLFVDSLAL